MDGNGIVIFDGETYSPHPIASSIIKPDLFKQRRHGDQAFAAGDEVVVTLDCRAHTLRLQSPTVDHKIDILRQHHNPQQQWVLNVNCGHGDYEVSLPSGMFLCSGRRETLVMHILHFDSSFSCLPADLLVA